MAKAPWTIDQVLALNAYQRLGYVHEFTCPENHERKSRVLVAKPDGWHCPTCDYRQDWAHDYMADRAMHPRNPLDQLRSKKE
jgi:hypothetical protein